MASLRGLIATDLQANDGRSGFGSALSACLFNPGFSFLLWHRTANHLYRKGFVRTAKLLARMNAAFSGCHFHLEAEIGAGLKLPHPTGIVVGSGVVIGNNATIYQNVTIGRAMRAEKYPNLGNDVTLFPNCVVSGGISIGNGAVVGAGAIVIGDVAPGAIMAGNPAKLLRFVEAETPVAS